MTQDMVKFLMPDGTEVSNDPRFGLEEALTKSLNAQPNRGDVGVTHEEQLAQTQVEHAASSPACAAHPTCGSSHS